MRTRLLVVLGSLIVMLTVAVAPAAAAGASELGVPQGVGAVLGPGQTILADHTTSDNSGMSGWGSSSLGTSGWGGSPWGMGFGWGGPWWAGMPLWSISAASGGTWPWAPWYYTPQWWTTAAFMR
jgi:hypothetical protein